MRAHSSPKRRRLFLQNEKAYSYLEQDTTSVVGRVATNATNQECHLTPCCCCYRVSLSPPSSVQSCARCKQAVCLVCTRTCEGGTPSSLDTSSPCQPTAPLCKPSVVAARKTRSLRKAKNIKASPLQNIPLQVGRRRPRVEDEDLEYSQQKVTHHIISGCKRTICRKCTVEDSMSQLVVCQDCHPIPNQSGYEDRADEYAMEEA